MQQDNPQQGPHGIAKRRGFEDGAQIRQQRRVDLREREASTTGAANLARVKFERLQIFQTAADGAARQSRRPRHSSDAAVPRRPRFRRRGQTPATLVQAGDQTLVAKTNRNLIDHSAGIAAAGPVVNPMSRQKNRRGAKQIQLFSGVALTGHFDNFFVRNNSAVRIVTI